MADEELEQLAQPHHANAIILGYAMGAGVQTLARRHGCSDSLVMAVVEGKRYGEVTGRWHPSIVYARSIEASLRSR